MGVDDLLGPLPGGKMEETQYGFSRLMILRNGSRRVEIDTGTLVFICALRHKEAFNASNYLPSAQEFHRQILILHHIHRWDFICVFDGCPPAAKRHEHTRRKSREGGIVVNSTFISICANVCRRNFIPFVVTPLEADMQVGRTREGSVAVCRDSDLVAYGNRLTVIVDCWPKEEFRVIDLDAPITEETRTSQGFFGTSASMGSK